MSDSATLLESIDECIVTHGGDLGGWTRCADEALQLFDGRVTLRAELREAGSTASSVHAHIFTTLHEHDDEVLDACVVGMGDNADTAIRQAAAIWMTGVAGPIRSFIDNKPVCMTCQAGVTGGDTAEGYASCDYGLSGLRAFVGPSFSRGFEHDQFPTAVSDTIPWFRFAAESAAPRCVHLAKVTVVSKGKEGWSRDLEIDGHDVCHHDSAWLPGVPGPQFGYVTRFAVFEFPRNSTEIKKRAELERTIRHFAEHLPKAGSVDQLMEDMARQGFDPELVHEAESISTIAFSRAMFEPHGIQYASTIVRARRDGRIETDIPLMSIPAYSRARALAERLRETMSEDEFQSLCLYNAESHAILQAIEAEGKSVDFTKMKFYPCIVPDRGVSEATMNQALALLNEWVERNRPARPKPWWKFW
jgi:hypothetical protein